MSTTPVKTAGCCDVLYNAGLSAYGSASKYGKSALSNVSSVAKTVWSAVSTFFGKVAVTLGAYLLAAKNTIGATLSTAKHAFVNLPPQAKIVGAVSLAATAVATALCCNCWKTAEKAAAAPAAAAAAAAAGAAAPVLENPAAADAQPLLQG